MRAPVKCCVPGGPSIQAGGRASLGPSNTRPRQGIQNGFTLMELILVIVLLGILAAMAIPRFADTSVFLQRGYFDELLQATRYAQKLAVSSHCQTRIDIVAGNYKIQQPKTVGDCPADQTPDWQTVSRPDGGGDFAGDAPEGITTTAAITFFADGTAGSDETVNVGARSFKVWQATGYVER